MKRRATPEERYKYNVRKQQETLEKFAEHEIEWAGHLLDWYRLNKMEIGDDEYRAAAFFQNREYLKKPGSLTLCYEMYLRCMNELPQFSKEIAFDLLRFRYKSYANVLQAGGYDGRQDWG